MNHKQAKEIIQSHLDWVDGDKEAFSKYNEKAFNDALRVLLKTVKDEEKDTRDTK